mgnify:CR=1 FL=1
MASATENEIRELEEKLKQADIVADPDLLDKLLVDGFFFTGQDGTVITKEQVLQSHRPAGARKFRKYETSDMRITDFDNAAVVTVRVDLATKTTQVVLLFTRFWLKRDGHWQIVGGSAVQLEHSH